MGPQKHIQPKGGSKQNTKQDSLKKKKRIKTSENECHKKNKKTKKGHQKKQKHEEVRGEGTPGDTLSEGDRGGLCPHKILTTKQAPREQGQDVHRCFIKGGGIRFLT